MKNKGGCAGRKQATCRRSVGLTNGRKFWIVLAVLLFASVSHCAASPFDGKGIFSFDFGYMGVAMQNNGWGLGLSYEHSVFQFAALKGSFSHITLKPSDSRGWLTTVGIALDARIYPLNQGLNRLYVGYGIGTDFLMGMDEGNEVYISHCPQVGWKENFLDYVMVEAYCGYRMKITNVSDFAMESGIVKHGFEYGITAKFNLKKIWQWMFGRDKKTDTQDSATAARAEAVQGGTKNTPSPQKGSALFLENPQK